MDYEKLYKEALERAKSFELPEYKNIMKYIFPELAESKDERIRKMLIEFFSMGAKNNSHTNGIADKDIIAWLEKQGEQVNCPQNLQVPNGGIVLEDFNGGEGNFKINLAFLNKKQVEEIENIVDGWNKVEPKFKVGDWIVNNGHSYLIADIDYENSRYLFEIGGYTHEQLNWEYIENADRNYHLWSIEDAKDGDVLAVTMYPEGTWIGILKEYNGCTFSSYCFVNTKGTFKLGTYNHGNGKAIHPATKEQRDLLFQKMYEEGYDWDAEKKELKR